MSSDDKNATVTGDAAIEALFATILKSARSGRPFAVEVRYTDTPDEPAPVAPVAAGEGNVYGTMACPHCGKETPHDHTDDEVLMYKAGVPLDFFLEDSGEWRRRHLLDDLLKMANAAKRVTELQAEVSMLAERAVLAERILTESEGARADEAEDLWNSHDAKIDEHNRLMAELAARPFACAHCGIDGGMSRDEVMAHIEVCPSHPLATARAESATLRAQLAAAEGQVAAAREEGRREAKALADAISIERGWQAQLGIHRIDCDPCMEFEGNPCVTGVEALRALRAARKATDAALAAYRAAFPDTDGGTAV